ncbi:MAG: winged helix-turn-helix domain-containing protein [Hyphomicrobiales bacterium]|nr:MAG: winged helix-turn-helix domain-containing protein [Hyphomicrobiales bacterium]
MSKLAIKRAFAIRNEKLTPCSRLVLVAICDEIEHDCALTCSISQNKIGRKVGVTHNTVARRVADLCELGYLTVTRQRDARGYQKTNIYRVNLPVGAEPSCDGGRS